MGLKMEDFKKLKWHEQLAAGWPLIMLFIGGAVGGACGGAAYAINAGIFNSDKSPARKYILTFLVGVGSIIVYVATIVVLALIFPNLFQ